MPALCRDTGTAVWPLLPAPSGSNIVRLTQTHRYAPAPSRSTFGGFASDNYWFYSWNGNAWIQNFDNDNQTKTIVTTRNRY